MLKPFAAASVAALTLCHATSVFAQLGSPEGHAHEHDHETHEELEEIFITASPLEHGRGELALPVATVDRDEVLSGLATTIGETIGQKPGVSTTGFAPGASRPVIRGQDAFRVRVLEDGIGTGDVSDLSADHGVPVNPLVARRIEILRGPATLRYGGGAIGGVVNTLTTRIPKGPIADEYQASAFAGYATAANARDGAATFDATTSRLNWHFDGYYRQAEEYEIPDFPGEQINTFNNAQGGAFGASYSGDNFRIGAAASDVDNEYGIPAPEDPAEPAKIDMRKLRYEIEGEWRPGEGTAPALGWIRELSFRNVFTDYRHEEIVLGEGVAARYDNEEWEGRVEALHKPSANGLHGAFGLHWRVKELAAGGEAEEFLDPTDTTMIALYAFEELAISEATSLQFAGRVESVTSEGVPQDDIGRDQDFFPLSGSVSLQTRPNESLGIGLTGSVSQRAPSAVELYARGPHEATATFEVGDPDLDEETSFAIDLSANGELPGGLRFDASVFYTRYQDFIFGRLTGRTCSEEGDCVAGDGEELEELLYESDDADFYGAEAAFKYDIAEMGDGVFGLDAQFDIVRAELDDGGNVPRITPIRWGFGAYYESTAIEGRVGFLRNEKQGETAEGETETGAFTMLSADLRYSMPVGERTAVDLFVSGRNLLDEDARNHVSFLKDDLLLPGRDVRFGVQLSF